MDLIGTLYVAPNGDAYRLRDVRAWDGHPQTYYTVLVFGGGATSSELLPDGSKKVWSPDRNGRRVHFMAARHVANTACNRWVNIRNSEIVWSPEAEQVTCKKCLTAMAGA